MIFCKKYEMHYVFMLYLCSSLRKKFYSLLATPICSANKAFQKQGIVEWIEIIWDTFFLNISY